jgi:hypothetical protein
MTAKKKPLKVIIPDEVLAKFPVEEREGLKATILEHFEGANPENLPGEPVPELPARATHCPMCGEELKTIFSNRLLGVTSDKGPFDLLYCPPCDEDFMRRTSLKVRNTTT